MSFNNHFSRNRIFYNLIELRPRGALSHLLRSVLNFVTKFQGYALLQLYVLCVESACVQFLQKVFSKVN